MEYPADEFDLWSETYDQDVRVDSFPFDGYERALEGVQALTEVQRGQRVLDIGTGTGNLVARFSACGCQVIATDFSPQMVIMAKHKVPQAQYVISDLRYGLPFRRPIRGDKGLFDCIVSAYVFHHFPLDQKIEILAGLRCLLDGDGRLVVADVAFQDMDAKLLVRQAAGDTWEEEYYWIAEVDLPALREAGFDAIFYPVSSCGGIFHMRLK